MRTGRISAVSAGIDHPGYIAFFEALLSHRLRLGQTLTQEELGAVLGLTLSRVREVTTLLEAEGMVQVRKRRGLTIFYPDVAFVGGTFQFREILECEGLRRFAEGVTPEWIARQRSDHAETIAEVRRTADPEAFAPRVRLLERSFHDSFINIFANEQLSMNFRRNSQKAYLLRLINPDAVGPANTILSLGEHGVVIDALENRDTEAAVNALKRHIANVLHRTMTH